ncbi:MAG TPA: hypothetical protein PKD17_10720 [Cellvibrionaceae bacterium]|nr:hypothetical protein [Cellvibrionaceae bacterium]HNG59239.1 hypothetical protein [Cellvibrionaceae bacterium]
MAVSIDEISTLEAILNEKLESERMRFSLSVHFIKDRLNDPRNDPAISITELQGIFNRLIAVHVGRLKTLKDRESFTVRCRASGIHIPCTMTHDRDKSGKVTKTIITITIMRKRDFKSKDKIILTV